MLHMPATSTEFFYLLGRMLVVIVVFLLIHRGLDLLFWPALPELRSFGLIVLAVLFLIALLACFGISF